MLKPYNLFLYLIILAGVVLLLSAGHTWQIFPAYLAILVTILILVLRKDKKRKVIAGIALIFLIALSALSLYIFPLLTLPTPSGNYQVGVRYEIVQTDRDETMTPEPGDTRKLYLKIWYPAKNGTQKTMYIEGGKETMDYLINKSNLPIPAFMFHHLAKAGTNSYLNAPIADGLFPLVTFSHGHAMWQSQSTSLMEELASQGMVVASIAHSHQTIFVAENNDTMLSFEKIVSLIKEKEIDTVKSNEYERRTNTAKSKSAMDSIIRDNIFNDKSANEFVDIWSADISSTIDMLVSENSKSASFFYQKLDIDKIGASGMSFGGAAAVETTLKDSRIKAALNMDGMQFGNLINDTTKAKILFLEANKFNYNLSKYGTFFDRSTDQVICLMFNNTKHTNFSDISMISPILTYLGMLGEIDGEFMVEQINKIVAGFFKAGFNKEPFQTDQYLIPGKIILPAN